ncbi:RagB/SusD family nutrient uptake outer membrane protein [Flavihumibacter rivuli]|uniref:RagB/SusD family nutrient uptake outer membrane protein n=1 Tax=Flavihumibacter rivuli TaxID=2838156 RepID=UPI001BDEBBBB|nr:RagB/SusD family nutrient uptake outer membrane protein [Flavihumibacter rivuli]ULQ57344.1 RagB/SusD family nutrient uptake outer membrane protein [Flavihumibacter rivuli]
MKSNIIKYTTILTLAVVAMATTSCKKDFTDPSRPSEEQVFSSPAGLTGVCVGLQRTYSLSRASSLYNLVTTTGLVTRELRLLNAGNLPEDQLNRGGTAVDGTNTMLAGLWTTSNKIIYDADKVIENANNLSDKGYAAGLIGYASIFKALSIGAMSMYWTDVPEGNGVNVGFVTRAQGFDLAIATIDNALAAIAANTPPANFNSSIPAGLDIVNTLQALKARFSLFNGKYDQALAAANLVDLTKRSTMNFEAANPNPIFDVHTSNFNVCQPLDSTMGLPVGLAPDLADKRVPFYMILSGSSAARFKINGFAQLANSAYPIYLPGEMTLIKAEALARKTSPDLDGALVELNKVVTKKASGDPFGVGADLPAIAGPLTADQLLQEIYRNRCVELYMSGLKLEDMRRFGRPNTERSRNFMPYPFRERDNNPNTPADPAF